MPSTTPSTTGFVGNVVPLVFPCPLVVDSRERIPFSFAGIRADAKDARRPLVIQLQGGKLDQGDYSLLGFETRVAVERKSLSDLFNTIGQGRGRFHRELERLSCVCEFSAVVCEADWSIIINQPPERSKLKPKIVYRSIIAWQQRFPTVHWWMMPGRKLAEITTFRLLERFWKSHRLEQANAERP